jgi:hypothetical protein
VPTRYPTAVQAILRLDPDGGELRLTIANNAGRELDEWVVYSRSLDDEGRRQVDVLLTRAGLRYGEFRGNDRTGWHSVVQPFAIDPDAAAD